MKKLTVALMCMIVATGAILAQNEAKQFSIKPYAGFSGSMFWGENAHHYDPRYGFHVGVEGEYQFAPKWSVAAGVAYSTGGAKIGYSDFYGERTKTETFKNDRIYVPVVARWYAWRGLSINAGLAPAFVVNTGDTHLGNTKSSRERKFDLTIPLGISYELKNHIVFGIEGFLGLLKIYPNNTTYTVEGVGGVTTNDLGKLYKLYHYNGFVSIGYKFRIK